MQGTLNKYAGIVLIFFFFSTLLSAQGTKKYPSLLWKISGNGLKKTSYLYGTMHVSKKLAYHLSDQFFEGIKSVEVVGLETNPATWVENMEKYGMFNSFKLSSSNYAGTIPNFYKDAFKLTILNNQVYAGMLAFDPDIINGLLYRFNKNKENYEENTYIDLFIYQAAAKWNKNIVSLEDFKTSLVKGKLADFPDEEGENLVYGMKNYKDHYQVYEKIEDAYRRGDLDDLDSLSKLSGRTKNYLKYLLEDRNEIFVHNIDSIIRKSSLFAGVGAAHLPGENGVIELLRKKGYTVEPVSPKISGKSTKVKDNLEHTFKTVPLYRQFTSDSLISFSAPGRLVDILHDETVTFRLYADMANGAYYSMIRLKTLAPLLSYNEAMLKQKIDSLLFENIPGKIISKQEITSNAGWQGFDIINQTRRGDLQRYNIFITDLELIIFKLGGKDDYVKTNDARQFFNSIQFAKRDNSFREFSPVTKGFSVKVPSNFFYYKAYSAQNVGKSEHLTAFDRSTKTFYGLIQSYYNDYKTIEEDTFELNVLCNNILKNYDFRNVIHRELKKDQGFPVIEFLASDINNDKIAAKIYIKGVHYYFVYVIGKDKADLNNQFLTSFRLTDFNSVNELKEMTDKDYAFTAKNEFLEDPESLIEEEVAQEYEKNIKTRSNQASSFDYVFRDKYVYSPSSAEHISIEFEKYNDYDYRDKEDVISKIRRNVVKGTSCYVDGEKHSEKDGVLKFEFTLKDTGSVRAIRSVIIVKQGVVYELRCPYDTTIGLQGWAKTFMETFQPTEAVIGKDIFENKFTILLNDLQSSDTTVRARADASMAGLAFQKEYLDEFLRVLNTPNFSKISEDSRAALLVNGGVIQDERVIQPYKDLYAAYADSSYLQICIIKGLAYLNTKNSYAAISDLLVKDPPLVGNDITVKDVFAVFYDSLELCKSFFPTMLNLVRFEEYKSSVYELMSLMVRKKIIQPSLYKAHTAELLAEANYELKRFNSSANAESNSPKSESELIAALTKAIEKSSGNSKRSAASGSGRSEERDNPLIADYAILLCPLYNTNADVKTFFGKLLKTKNNDVLFPVYINMLENGIKIKDSVWNYFSKSSETRLELFNELRRLNHLELFDKTYLSQRALCEAEILNSIGIEQMYQGGGEKGNDELEFITSIEARNKYEKGRIYIFKRPEPRLQQGIEKWTYAFVPEAGNEITSEVEVLNTSYFTEKDLSQAYVNELLKEFSYSYRSRYFPQQN
jgi:uncharacterized protein YbaP (TraB family)